MTPFFVLAGTELQAIDFVRERGWAPRDWISASRHTVRDCDMHPIVYCVGTYWERRDLHEVISMLSPVQPRYLDEDGDDLMAELEST